MDLGSVPAHHAGINSDEETTIRFLLKDINDYEMKMLSAFSGEGIIHYRILCTMSSGFS